MNDIKMTNVAVEQEEDEAYQVYRDRSGAIYFPLDERIQPPYKWFVVFSDGSMGLHSDYPNLTPIRVLEIKFQDIIKDNPENGKD